MEILVFNHPESSGHVWNLYRFCLIGRKRRPREVGRRKYLKKSLFKEKIKNLNPFKSILRVTLIMSKYTERFREFPSWRTPEGARSPSPHLCRWGTGAPRGRGTRLSSPETVTEPGSQHALHLPPRPHSVPPGHRLSQAENRMRHIFTSCISFWHSGFLILPGTSQHHSEGSLITDRCIYACNVFPWIHSKDIIWAHWRTVQSHEDCPCFLDGDTEAESCLRQGHTADDL